jgi:hypothetical protein
VNIRSRKKPILKEINALKLEAGNKYILNKQSVSNYQSCQVWWRIPAISAEAGGLQIQGHTEQLSETLSKNKI